jgi:hypothetical protein
MSGLESRESRYNYTYRRSREGTMPRAAVCGTDGMHVYDRPDVQ